MRRMSLCGGWRAATKTRKQIVQQLRATTTTRRGRRARRMVGDGALTEAAGVAGAALSRVTFKAPRAWDGLGGKGTWAVGRKGAEGGWEEGGGGAGTKQKLRALTASLSLYLSVFLCLSLSLSRSLSLSLCLSFRLSYFFHICLSARLSFFLFFSPLPASKKSSPKVNCG
ncbi:hypothetical protein DFJ73DRAFT_468544 [Zopfochytrium polystomum]|nr:hypothetical protein DFJ73DRAFT_468544 [Zopfochytrium polystomum]